MTKPNASPNSRVAVPLDLCHPASHNINIERAVVPDTVFLALLGYGVMSGRQGNPKLPLIIRGERCDFRSLFVLHDESGICERLRTGNAGSDRPTLSWTKRNHAFDPCSWSGLCLPQRKAARHDEEHQNYSEFSELHYLITLTTSNRVKTFGDLTI